MTVTEFLANVRRIIEDSGMRWSNDVINEYLVEGVNEVFRKAGGITDTIPFDLVQSTSEYEISGVSGRVTAIRLRPENSTLTVTLPQVQVADLPIDFSVETDPTCYALSQVDMSGALSGTQKIMFDNAPARSSAGLTGFYVDFEREWAPAIPILSPETVVIPVLPKFDRPLTNLVAGKLLLEVNDDSLSQKGIIMEQRASQEISNRAYVDSLSKYTYNLDRPFP